METKKLAVFIATGVLSAVLPSLAAQAQTPALAIKPSDVHGAVADVQEVLWLDEMAAPANWNPAEAEAVAASLVDGHPSVTLHIPVDYHAGEVAYPIGWPRMYYRSPATFPWREYDFFEFKLMPKMSRADIPHSALTLALKGPQKDEQLSQSFGSGNLKLGEWSAFSLPLSKLAKAQRISSLGLSISESNYNDKDVLDFTLTGFRLVRSSACKITKMECQGVLYSQAPVLRVSLEVVGPSSDCGRGVPFRISANGKALRTETLPVVRGANVLDMDVTELCLPKGDYTLTAFPSNSDRTISVGFKVVDSPWEK